MERWDDTDADEHDVPIDMLDDVPWPFEAAVALLLVVICGLLAWLSYRG